MQTQQPMYGGFGKTPGDLPDLLHAYFGVAGLALLGEAGVARMDPALNLSERAAAHLRHGTVFARSGAVQP